MSIVKFAQSLGWISLPSGACRSCPAAACQLTTVGAPHLHHGRRSSSIWLPAQAVVQKKLLSLLCVSWRNSLGQQKCLKISILLAQQIISLIKVGKISKSFESKQDPQGLHSYQTEASYFSIPCMPTALYCVAHLLCIVFVQVLSSVKQFVSLQNGCTKYSSGRVVQFVSTTQSI